ncbi:unnamed protein product [Protopolystoma xenopodis]|uniref:Uncharacterized protein n=1 Tax=Protopolystoma xenopodis TaxID=117903 RepID=A0A448XJT2_9PLAT|nr:unnamed protein product [Protopolystoma xenopodis]
MEDLKQRRADFEAACVQSEKDRLDRLSRRLETAEEQQKERDGKSHFMRFISILIVTDNWHRKPGHNFHMSTARLCTWRGSSLGA